MSLDIAEFMLIYEPAFRTYLEEQGVSNLLDDMRTNKDLLLKYRKEYDMKLDIKKDFDIPTNEHNKITMLKEMYYKHKNDSTP